MSQFFISGGQNIGVSSQSASIPHLSHPRCPPPDPQNPGNAAAFYKGRSGPASARCSGPPRKELRTRNSQTWGLLPAWRGGTGRCGAPEPLSRLLSGPRGSTTRPQMQPANSTRPSGLDRRHPGVEARRPAPRVLPSRQHLPRPCVPTALAPPPPSRQLLPRPLGLLNARGPRSHSPRPSAGAPPPAALAPPPRPFRRPRAPFPQSPPLRWHPAPPRPFHRPRAVFPQSPPLRRPPQSSPRVPAGRAPPNGPLLTGPGDVMAGNSPAPGGWQGGAAAAAPDKATRGAARGTRPLPAPPAAASHGHRPSRRPNQPGFLAVHARRRRRGPGPSSSRRARTRHRVPTSPLTPMGGHSPRAARRPGPRSPACA